MHKTTWYSLILSLLLTVPVFADNIYTKYNFVPGEKIIAFEDLSATKIGDIPIGAFRLSGPAEVVLENNQRWLKTADCNIDITIPKDVKDLTLEFYLKQNQTDGAFRLFLDNEAQDYSSCIDVGANNVYAQGAYQGEQMPTSGTDKDFYAPNKPVQIALMIQKQRTQLYVNKILAMSNTGFNPVMPTKLRIGFLGDATLMVKDFTLATEIPDIADDILTKGKYTSHGVKFDSGSSQVKEESYSVLKQVAEVLQEHSDLKLTIVGHTDNTGTAENNQKLSVARAENIKNYLVAQFKIQPDRLQTAGKGDKEPVAENKTPDGRGRNRRVEFIKIN
jgi:outer membrane protein OmpA-like peptidoglycan-associated protein